MRHIASDGKVYIDADSHLPMTLLGNEVLLFSDNLDEPGEYRRLEGGTVEALGAIHFSSPEHRSGKQGIKPSQLYLELNLHGDDRKKQAEALGIRAGDSIIMARPIKRSVGQVTTNHGQPAGL